MSYTKRELVAYLIGNSKDTQYHTQCKAIVKLVYPILVDRKLGLELVAQHCESMMSLVEFKTKGKFYPTTYFL